MSPNSYVDVANPRNRLREAAARKGGRRGCFFCLARALARSLSLSLSLSLSRWQRQRRAAPTAPAMPCGGASPAIVETNGGAPLRSSLPLPSSVGSASCNVTSVRRVLPGVLSPWTLHYTPWNRLPPERDTRASHRARVGARIEPRHRGRDRRRDTRDNTPSERRRSLVPPRTNARTKRARRHTLFSLRLGKLVGKLVGKRGSIVWTWKGLSGGLSDELSERRGGKKRVRHGHGPSQSVRRFDDEGGGWV